MKMNWKEEKDKEKEKEKRRVGECILWYKKEGK